MAYEASLDFYVYEKVFRGASKRELEEMVEGYALAAGLEHGARAFEKTELVGLSLGGLRALLLTKGIHLEATAIPFEKNVD